MRSFRERESASGDPHGWNSLENYLHVHHRRLNEFRDHFVVGDNLSYELVDLHTFAIKGRVHCEHGLFLQVDKTLEINDTGQVRTLRYSYHAGVAGDRDRPIFRYDNFHPYTREGHQDEHHKHRFNQHTWEETEPPEWIGRHRWPHLDQAIEELRKWWADVGQALDLESIE